MKWVSRITSTLFVIVLICLVVVVVSARWNDGNVFGYQVDTVLSGSMEPGIQTGSVIISKSAHNVSDFNKGDIVKFKSGDKMVTHRIEEVKNGGQAYVTKGDNNNAKDPELLKADNIVATYTGITIPYVGYALTYAQTKAGTALLLILPGAFLIGSAVITVWELMKETDDKWKKEKDQITSNH